MFHAVMDGAIVKREINFYNWRYYVRREMMLLFGSDEKCSRNRRIFFEFN